ncbi:MAG TPA: CopD family protein [Acidocella sp.]|nr:CopD family protein [Acidocella sp.]
MIFFPIALERIASDVREQLARSMTRLLRVSLFIALTAGAIWLILEAIYIIDSDRWYDVLASLAPVIWDTNFGHLLVIRLALLILAVSIFSTTGMRIRICAAISLTAFAIALQAGLGHGAAMAGIEGNVLLAALVLHLLAAGLWLGSLLPLYIAISAASPEVAHKIAKRYSVLGTICVITLIATATLQAWFLAGGISGLVGTAYGRVAMAKTFMFLVLIVFAACNRNIFTPALIGDQASLAKSHLRRIIFAEMLAGLTVVILAGILLQLSPGMDMAMAGNM